MPPVVGAQDDVNITVVVHDDVTACADAAFVHDERAEIRRQRQAAVIRIAGRQSRLRRRLRRGRPLTTQRDRTGRTDTRKHEREKYAFHGDKLYRYVR